MEQKFGINSLNLQVLREFCERELLLRRCPGIARHLPLNAIASFLCVTPQQLSRIRKTVTFSEK